MSDKPIRITSGTHKGKIQCTQYTCLNNYGVQTGIIHEAGYPSSCCMLENPSINDFGNGVWGCSNERYGYDVDNSDDKCKVMGTDYCKNECPIGIEAKERENTDEN